MRRTLLTLLLLLLPSLACSALVDTYRFSSVEHQQRALTLAKELRCPQCQNQNLLESTSPIAQDLRLEVYRLVDGGDSDEEIIALMTRRYGDFVLYRPPLRAGTLVLWFAPALLLTGAIVALLIAVRRRRTPASGRDA